MAVETLRRRGDLARIALPWQRLFEASGSRNPFVHPAWCAAWVDSYESADIRVVVDRAGDERIRGLVPCVAVGVRRRHWRTLGVPFVDFGDPLVERAADGPDLVLRALAETRSSWDSVTLSGLNEGLARQMSIQSARHGLDCHLIGSDICPRIDRPDGTWVQSLPPRRRKRLVAMQRRLKATMNVAYSVVEEPAAVMRAVRAFESLRLQSWWCRGRYHTLPKSIRSATHGSFLGLAVPAMAGTGAASLAELRSGSRLLASSVLLRAGGSVLVALKATDPRLPSAFSPGLALDMFVIQHETAKGSEFIEFGRGDEPYKMTLAARPRTTCDVLVTARGAVLPVVRAKVRRGLSECEYRWRTRKRM